MKTAARELTAKEIARRLSIQRRREREAKLARYDLADVWQDNMATVDHLSLTVPRMYREELEE